MKEDVIRHLEIIQTIIARLANNSFLLKGWTVTVAAGLLALAAKEWNVNFALLALFPAIAFWGLDAYYLRQERLYRRLYDRIRNATDDELKALGPFSLDTNQCRGSTDGLFKTLWSPTILGSHGVIAIILVVVALAIKFVK